MAHALSEHELLALLDRLADGEWHSGEQLAAASGISRAALAKRVERLKDWQLQVDARQGLGYRLAAPLERLDEARLQDAVGPGVQLRVVAVTDSTSSQLMRAAADDDPQALLAELQTAGRGRRGREWISPFGAQLALSLAWSFEAMPAQLSALPLAVGVVCARALRTLGIDGIGLKWPNDIVALDEAGAVRKLAGILLEHRGEGGGGCRIVVGVGVNLSMRAEQATAVQQPWLNLEELLRAQRREPVSRNTLAAVLLCALRDLLAGYAADGFAPLAAEWQRLDVTRDRPVRVQLGEREIDGFARGIDDSGALIVDAGGSEHRLNAGEVSLRLRP
ncbi:MAG: biotin--[acetyl-CoA-carboxylase] ligase [Gammaproteobacteria bacterium]